ncbi:unnamed protein product [Rotaria sordida]|uniref:Uncharacterized protein n=1 Tax=Rotaria sordida TaxID=392033 RepID=A0A814Y4E2_9BILA|nr:unnamed protein product [Rotaria sordida]CAF3969630.1 unnamed protein product [Rotaria sordida]
MQLTTILAVFFSCLVLFTSIGYTNSTVVKNKHSIVRPDPFVKSRNNFVSRHGNLHKVGRRQSVARAIMESIKQRHKHL